MADQADDDYVLDDLRQHPRVCANCFRFRHDAAPVPPRIRAKARNGAIWAGAVMEPWWRTATMGVAAPPGDTVSERAPRTDCPCGAVSPYASLREPGEPVDYPTVIELCQQIRSTLVALRLEHVSRDELRQATRYAHDPDTLFDVARYLKSTPAYQFKDDNILTAAVEMACRAGSLDDLSTTHE